MTPTNPPQYSIEDLGDSKSPLIASKPDVVKSFTEVPSKRIDLANHGQHHWFTVQTYETPEDMIKALRGAGVLGRTSIVPDGETVAFTDCWSNEESLENGLGDRNCAGHIYIVDVSLETIAHEATHMALGILARTGVKNLKVVSSDAEKNEENLCSLVGFITHEVTTALTYMKADDPVNDLVVKSVADSTDVTNPPKLNQLIYTQVLELLDELVADMDKRYNKTQEDNIIVLIMPE